MSHYWLPQLVSCYSSSVSQLDCPTLLLSAFWVWLIPGLCFLLFPKCIFLPPLPLCLFSCLCVSHSDFPKREALGGLHPGWSGTTEPGVGSGPPRGTGQLTVGQMWTFGPISWGQGSRVPSQKTYQLRIRSIREGPLVGQQSKASQKRLCGLLGTQK